MLDRIEIKNFRSIRSVKLELLGLNVVIGPNGAGKSNLIGAFRLLGQIVLKRLQEYVPQQGGQHAFCITVPRYRPTCP